MSPGRRPSGSRMLTFVLRGALWLGVLGISVLSCAVDRSGLTTGASGEVEAEATADSGLRAVDSGAPASSPDAARPDAAVPVGPDGGVDAGVSGPDAAMPPDPICRTNLFPCGLGPQCACDGECCDFSCGSECHASCAGVTTQCHVHAQGSENINVDCRGGAHCTIDASNVSNVDSVDCRASTCEVECGDVSNCRVRCRAGSSCLVRCTDTSNCRLEECLGGGVSCPGPGIILVCNRPCPDV